MTPRGLPASKQPLMSSPSLQGRKVLIATGVRSPADAEVDRVISVLRSAGLIATQCKSVTLPEIEQIAPDVVIEFGNANIPTNNGVPVVHILDGDRTVPPPAGESFSSPVDPHQLLSHVEALIRLQIADALVESAQRRLHEAVQQRDSARSALGVPPQEGLDRAVFPAPPLSELGRLIARGIPNGLIYIMDAGLRCVLADGPLLTSLGFSREMVEGRNYHEIFEEEVQSIMEPRFRKALSGYTAEYETLFRGRSIWAHYIPMRNERGEVQAVMVLALDITERKRVDEDLRRSSATTRMALQAAHAGTFDADIETGRITWSDELQKLYGFAPGTFQNRLSDWAECLLPEERDSVLAGFEENIRRGGSSSAEFRIRRRDTGEIRWIEARGEVVRDAEGQARRMVGVNTDITERRLREEQLRESEARFRALADNIPQLSWMADSTGRIFWYNQRWFDYTGRSLEQMDGPGARSVYHPDHQDRVLDRFTKAVADGVAWEDTFPLLGKDGKFRWFLSRALPIRDENGVVLRWFGTNTDITEQREAEQELQHQFSILDAIATNAANALFLSDAAGRTTFVNPAAATMFGYTQEEMLGERLHEKIHPRHPDGTPYAIEECPLSLIYSTGETVHEHQDVFFRKDGSPVDVSCSNAPVFAHDGSIAGSVLVVADITDRKRMDDVLRESRETFKLLAEAVPEIVWTASPNGDVEYFNQRWTDYTGLTLDESRAWGWQAIVHPDDLPETNERWKSALARGVDYETEYRFLGADGIYRWFLGRAVPLRGKDGQIQRWFGTCTDIDDLKRAQDALVQAEKLASVGRMAATIAHEINNPLETITNTIFLVAHDKNLSPENKHYLKLADEELARVSHLTKQTLAFYREGGQRRLVEIAALAESVINIYGPKIRAKSVNVERRSRGNSKVWASGGELTQVISNLLLNSLDAVGEGGHIIVRTQPVTFKKGTRAVRVTVADDGTGIPATEMRRIFEPFFTTKKDVGTGLGLWISRQLVEKYHGRIRVRSRLGCGTVFTATLPIEQRTDGNRILNVAS